VEVMAVQAPTIQLLVHLSLTLVVVAEVLMMVGHLQVVKLRVLVEAAVRRWWKRIGW
jgi:hypothetical protein